MNAFPQQPAPWRVQPWSDGTEHLVFDALGNLVVVCPSEGSANFIAAAPLMAAALRRLIGLFGEDTGEEFREMAEEARALDVAPERLVRMLIADARAALREANRGAA